MMGTYKKIPPTITKKYEKWAIIKNPAYHVEPVTIGNHSGTSSGKTQSGEFAPSASLWIVFLH